MNIAGLYLKRRSGLIMSRLYPFFAPKSKVSSPKGRGYSLRQDRAAGVAKVVPDAAMKLVHSDEIGILVAILVKASIIHSRCVAFEEVAELKGPFVLEKILGYRLFSKEEYDRAGDDMANASYPFLTELTVDPYAC
ncbi:hypothetical protein Tco_1534484 [Tanacetum coccineum]